MSVSANTQSHYTLIKNKKSVQQSEIASYFLSLDDDGPISLLHTHTHISAQHAPV